MEAIKKRLYCCCFLVFNEKVSMIEERRKFVSHANNKRNQFEAKIRSTISSIKGLKI